MPKASRWLICPRQDIAFYIICYIDNLKDQVQATRYPVMTDLCSCRP